MYIIQIYRPRYMRLGPAAAPQVFRKWELEKLEDAEMLKADLEEQRRIKADGGYPWKEGKEVRGYMPNIYDRYSIIIE